MVQKVVVLCLLLGVYAAEAANALFPHPIHLVRRIDDPFAKTPKSVDQYCYGNIIVSISGQTVTITDYDAQQVTEIDHAQGTYSVTRFDEIAKMTAARRTPQSSSAWKTTPLGAKRSAAGRSVDAYAIENGRTKIEIGFDRSVTISRDAAEALVGAAYPNTRREEHEFILHAAEGSARPPIRSNATSGSSSPAPEAAYALPAEKSITLATDSGAVTVRDSILRIDGDLPPRDALLIEPGARRVDSRIVRFGREMHDADTIPTHP